MNEYEKIGTKSFEDLSVFVDTESITTQSASRYKLSYLDTEGNESVLSEAHKTIHLTINEGLNRTINLIWDDYEGFYYSTFDIYRGSKKQGMVKIAEIAGNLFSFTDLTPPFGKLYYQIVVEKPEPCIITKSKSTAEDYSSTKSNIVDHEILLSSYEAGKSDNLIKIYPNPTRDILFVQLQNQDSSTKYEITIFDMMGRPIRNTFISDSKSEIDVSFLNKGLYRISITGEEMTYSKTILKE
jgi:hypothetical protein